MAVDGADQGDQIVDGGVARLRCQPVVMPQQRMQVAAQKLLNTSASLAQIAEIVGCESEAAFSRAFKKSCGTASATWRRSRGHGAV